MAPPVVKSYCIVVTLHYHSFSSIRLFCITWPRLVAFPFYENYVVLHANFACPFFCPGTQLFACRSNKVFLSLLAPSILRRHSRRSTPFQSPPGPGPLRLPCSNGNTARRLLLLCYALLCYALRCFWLASTMYVHGWGFLLVTRSRKVLGGQVHSQTTKVRVEHHTPKEREKKMAPTKNLGKQHLDFLPP